MAADDFGAAHRSIHSAWVEPLHVLPYIGRQVRSLEALSAAASTVTSTGQRALTQVQTTLRQPHRTATQRAAAITRLATTLTGLDRTVNGVDLGPSTALLPALAAKRNTFVTDLTQLRSGLDKGAGATNAMADLLNRHRTYLILTANNAEMRSGQGMYLQAGTVTSKGGRLTLGSFRPTATLVSAKPVVTVGGDLAARWGSLGLGDDYRKLGFSPQYTLNAPVAAAMWKAQTGQAVDGVFTIDVVALKDLLGAIGPVSAQGVTLDAGNVEQALFVTQYIGATSDAANAARREGLGLIAGAVFDAVQRGQVSLPKVAAALDSAVNGRDLLAWSSTPAVEADWQAAGAGGDTDPDGILLGLDNLGANKLDPYVAVASTLTSQARGANTEITVTATFHNQTPSGLPPYVAGEGPGATPGDYRGLASLDLPKYAAGVTVRSATAGGEAASSAARVLVHGSDGPSNVVAIGVDLPSGDSATVTWTFVLAGHHGALRVDPSARVPSVTWTTPGHTFTDDTAHTVNW